MKAVNVDQYADPKFLLEEFEPAFDGVLADGHYLRRATGRAEAL